MQKYHRPTTKKGRAWAKKFGMRNPTEIDKYRLSNVHSGTPTSGLTKDCFVDPNAYSHKEEDKFRKIMIRLDAKDQQLFMYYNSKCCYFVHSFLDIRIKYISRMYSDRRDAMIRYTNNGITWRERRALSESE